MSLFRPDLVWFPDSVDYPAQLLTEHIWLADYMGATLITTIFATLQVVAGTHILREYLRSKKQRPTTGGLLKGLSQENRQRFNSWYWMSASVAILYLVSAIIYWTIFGKRYHSVTNIPNEFNFTEEQALEWFRGNANNDGVKLICIPGSVNLLGLESPKLCKIFKLEGNMLADRVPELTFTSLVEALVLLTDVLLVYRCHIIFADLPWVSLVALALFVLSLAGPIMGIVILAKVASLGDKSDPWFEANFSEPSGFRFIAQHSTTLVIALSVAVNVFVTVAITTRLMLRRRTMHKLSGGHRQRDDDIYFSITAILVESAFPSALCGILAALFPRVGQGSLEMINFSPRVLWVGFTALAPQLIIIRVLPGHAWSKDTMAAQTHFSSRGRAIVFAPIPQDLTVTTGQGQSVSGVDELNNEIEVEQAVRSADTSRAMLDSTTSQQVQVHDHV